MEKNKGDQRQNPENKLEKILTNKLKSIEKRIGKYVSSVSEIVIVGPPSKDLEKFKEKIKEKYPNVKVETAILGLYEVEEKSELKSPGELFRNILNRLKKLVERKDTKEQLKSIADKYFQKEKHLIMELKKINPSKELLYALKVLGEEKPEKNIIIPFWISKEEIKNIVKKHFSVKAENIGIYCLKWLSTEYYSLTLIEKYYKNPEKLEDQRKLYEEILKTLGILETPNVLDVLKKRIDIVDIPKETLQEIMEAIITTIVPAITSVIGAALGAPLGTFLGSLIVRKSGNLEDILKVAEEYGKLSEEFKEFVVSKIAYEYHLDKNTVKNLLETLAGKREEIEEKLGEIVNEINEKIEKLENEIREIRKILEELKGEVEKLKEASRVSAKTIMFSNFKYWALGIKYSEGKYEIVPEGLGKHFKLVRTKEYKRLSGEITKNLERDGLVVIVGPKGIGKSVLAAYTLAEKLRKDLKNTKKSLILNLSEYDEYALNETLAYCMYKNIEAYLLYDPSPTTKYKPWTIRPTAEGRLTKQPTTKYEPWQEPPVPTYSPMGITGIADTIKNIIRKLELGSGKVHALIVLSKDIWETIKEELENTKFNNKHVKEYIVELEKLGRALKNEKFLEGIILSCPKSNIPPKYVKKYAGIIARDFAEGYTLIARLVCEEAAKTRKYKKIRETLEEAKGVAKWYILKYIERAILGIEKVEDWIEESLVISRLLLVRNYVKESPLAFTYGVPYISTPKMLKLLLETIIKTLNVNIGLKDFTSKGIHEWFSIEHEDLIEEVLDDVVKVLKGEEISGSKHYVNEVSEWKSITIEEGNYEKLCWNIVEKMFSIKSLLFSNKSMAETIRKHWKEATLILGASHVFPGHHFYRTAKVIKPKIGRNLSELFIAKNKIPALSQKIFLSGLFEEILAKAIQPKEIIKEIKSYSKARNGFTCSALESMYVLGLSLILAHKLKEGFEEYEYFKKALIISARALEFTSLLPYSDRLIIRRTLYEKLVRDFLAKNRSLLEFLLRITCTYLGAPSILKEIISKVSLDQCSLLSKYFLALMYKLLSLRLSNYHYYEEVCKIVNEICKSDDEQFCNYAKAVIFASQPLFEDELLEAEKAVKYLENIKSIQDLSDNIKKILSNLSLSRNELFKLFKSFLYRQEVWVLRGKVDISIRKGDLKEAEEYLKETCNKIKNAPFFQEYERNYLRLTVQEREAVLSLLRIKEIKELESALPTLKSMIEGALKLSLSFPLVLEYFPRILEIYVICLAATGRDFRKHLNMYLLYETNVTRSLLLPLFIRVFGLKNIEKPDLKVLLYSKPEYLKIPFLYLHGEINKDEALKRCSSLKEEEEKNACKEFVSVFSGDRVAQINIIINEQNNLMNRIDEIISKCEVEKLRKHYLKLVQVLLPMTLLLSNPIALLLETLDEGNVEYAAVIAKYLALISGISGWCLLSKLYAELAENLVKNREINDDVRLILLKLYVLP